MTRLKFILKHRFRRLKHRLKYYAGLEERKEWFDVVGISSTVYPEKDEDYHVIFLDIEDAKFTEVQEACERVLETYFIFSSSINSFHVISPVLRTKKDAKKIMKSIPIQDNNHTEIGYKRGDWVLRATDKPDKPEPVLLYSKDKLNMNKLYSKPHLRYLKQEYNSTCAEDLLTYGKTVGEKLRMVKYFTFK